MPIVLVPAQRRDTFRPNATIAIGIVTLLAFALEGLAGGSTSIEVLLRMGASEHDLVWKHHQLFRLLCPAFLHIGLLHILANGYAFLQLAPFIERIWGSSRLVILYVLSAIGGTVASSLFGHMVSAGASGAVFGLLGFLIAVGWSGRQRDEVRDLVKSYFGQGLIFWAAFNLWYGFQPNSHVDNLGHIGGLVTGLGLGFVLTGVLVAPPRVKVAAGACALLVAASFASCFVFASRADAVRLMEDREDSSLSIAYRKAVDAYNAGQYDTAASLFERAVALAPKDVTAPIMLELEGQALMKARRPKAARESLERSWDKLPRQSVALKLAGIALVETDTRAAVTWAERSAQAPDSHGDLRALLALSDVLDKLGDTELAVDALERAKKVAHEQQRPEPPGLSERIAELREKLSKNTSHR